MPFSIAFMRKLDVADEGLKDILWSLLEEIERDREESVTKKEFLKLTEIVSNLVETTRELAEAQNRTENRLDRVENRLDRIEKIVEELADAQKRTEQKIEELADTQKRTEQKIEELADAQKRTEQKIEELADAQKRTEKKVEELADAQKRTENRLDRIEKIIKELAEAQKQTEQELRQLCGEHKETRRQLGGLAMTVGYGLEDKAYPALPNLLHRDFGIVVQERLVRRFVKDKKGKDIEVNIFGKAVMNGEDITVIGEGKSQLSENDIRDFLRKKIKPLEYLYPHLFPVLITYMITSPGVETFAKDQGIALYYSYDFYPQISQ